jgi:hypothetical protein
VTGAPGWKGATAGQPPLAAQVNQFLGPHAATMVYAGTQQAAQSTTGSGAVNSNGLWIAQSFTSGAGQTAVGRVVLTLAVTGSPAPLTVGLFANSAGAPAGSALVSVTVPKDFLTGTGTAFSIPLPAAVAASTTYWVVATAVGDASDYFSWSKSNQTSGASTSTSGTAWTAQTYGLLYQVYDQSLTGSLTHTFEDSGARWAGFEYSGALVTGLQEYTVAQASGYVESNRVLSYSGTSLTGVA